MGSFGLDAVGRVSPSALLSSANTVFPHRTPGYLGKDPWGLAACATVDPGSSIPTHVAARH